MDQTPIPFTFNAKKTLELVGKRTVHIRKSTNDTKRVTCALTVTASGKVLPPMLIFKGSPNGRIMQEFPTFPNNIVYACQVNAWMDERMMLLWVDQVLKPYVATAPPGIVPFLLLDSYRCHMMQTVVRAIEDLGCEVDHIPGGCTCFCQPVDVGVNKPLKARLKQKWEAWMIDEGLQYGIIRPPTRRHIAEWCSHAYCSLPEQLVRNAWRHAPYSYFSQQQGQQDVHGDKQGQDNNADENTTIGEDHQHADEESSERPVAIFEDDDETTLGEERQHADKRSTEGPVAAVFDDNVDNKAITERECTVQERRNMNTRLTQRQHGLHCQTP
jgi:hypothetical protein